MPNQITTAGIEIQTLEEIVVEIVEGTTDVPGLQQIYGADINVDSNSPDGQMVNIFALAKKDILDLIVEDYNSKDPDQAVGVALDGISQLCGLTRKPGSYTLTNITVVADRIITLDGLDNPDAVPFTVADENGNKFYLLETVALSIGSNVLAFRAALLGVVQVSVNTITVPVTVILGVTSVNNPTAPDSIGTTQETDAQFRLRRQKSVSAPSQGYLQSLYGGLNDIADLVDALVVENNTSSTDGDGVPAHSIWVIVIGGSDADVAQAIYNYRNAGCGMYGAEDVDITQVDGTTFTVHFDRGTTEALYAKMHISVIGGGSYDADALKDYLVANWEFSLNGYADVTTLSELVRAYNPNLVVSFTAGEGLSNDDISFDTIVFPTSKDKKFTLSTTDIDIT